MKIFALLLFFILFTGTAFGQIEKGTIYFGGTSDMNFTSNLKEEGDDNFSMGFSGGYFPVNNLLIGAGAGRTFVDNFIAGRGQAIVLQAYSRFYFKNFFASSGYQTYKVEENRAKKMIMFQIGYAAFLSRYLAIEPSFNYGIALGDYYVNEYSLFLGFGIYINRGNDEN